MKVKGPAVPVRTSTADGTIIPLKFVEKPFPYHYELKARIDALSDLGWGIGHLEDDSETLPEHPENWGIRVPMVLPGELVIVKVFKNMDDYSEGKKYVLDETFSAAFFDRGE